MNIWNDKPYYALGYYYKELYGQKVYKIALNANLSCPNRDGKLDTRGCLFCSEGGSGDFASDKNLSITHQIEQGKELIRKKSKGAKFIAYFQAFTNTYGDLDYLREIYEEAILHPDIVGISIATRPDCLDDDILTLLHEVNKKKKVWIELGLQSIHENTAKLIRRGYSLDCFDLAVKNLSQYSIDIVVHLIIGLPGETYEDLLNTIDYVVSKPIHGIKLQLLHILKGTDLANYYHDCSMTPLSLQAYADLIVDCIERIPQNIVIHRITGDGPKDLLLAPLWSANKKLVLNTIMKRFKDRSSYQGKYFD
ncbi:MAG: TIGR01212 family radical SAM protein [Firmicutes bacterium HGW-Firmicutes-7]|nr:MAG: TIGR01212 family radical SAM protein [Firmicutes bacterium HGW-Firmicutes-7]